MKIIFYIALFIVLFIAYVRYLEATTVFLPDKNMQATPEDIGLHYEDIYFSTIDNVTLNGWLVRATPEETHYRGKGTIIFLHGNAGNISGRLQKIRSFCKLGLNVFIIDYRGYGRSKGRPNEQGMYYDALAAWDYLKRREDIDTNKIIAYGASLGGAAAVELAGRRQVACLILDSTFTSAKDMAKVVVPFVPSFLLNIEMDSISKIKKIYVPKLIIHSPEDETVPFYLGEDLYEAAVHPKKFLEISGTHNEGYSESEETFVNGISEFLSKYNLQ